MMIKESHILNGEKMIYHSFYDSEFIPASYTKQLHKKGGDFYLFDLRYNPNFLKVKETDLVDVIFERVK